MPTIDLNVNFDDVKDEDIFLVVPNGSYQFFVKGIEPTTTAKQRPMLIWSLGIEHEGKSARLLYNTVLPWINEGELDAGGVGLLVAVTKAVGKPWTGSQLVTEEYIGLGGTVEVIQKPKHVKDPVSGQYVPDLNAPPVNDIKGFKY